jgi:hypothetical protein
MKVSEVPINALQKAILDLHGWKSTRVESAPVKEVFEGETLWEGVVQVLISKIILKLNGAMYGPMNWKVQRKGVSLRYFIRGLSIRQKRQ